MTITLAFCKDKTTDDIFSLPFIMKFNSLETMHEKINILHFDTLEHDLYKAGILFYSVNKNDKWQVTLKGMAKSSIPGTWDVETSEQPLPTVEVFQDKKMEKIINQLIGDKVLIELLTIKYDRQTNIMETDNQKQIRIAFDKGNIIAGGNEEFISEVSLSSINADISDLLQLAVELASIVPLQVEVDSKYLRGLHLTGFFEKAQEAAIDLSVSAEAGLTRLMTSQAERVFAAQKDFIRRYDDPETLHQLRVQIRRLRAFLLFAKPVLNNDGYLQWKDSLKSWGHSMNVLRDIDVLLALWRELAALTDIRQEDVETLENVVQTERKNLIEELRTDIINGKSTMMLLGFELWLHKNAFLLKAAKLVLKKFSLNRLKKWVLAMHEMGNEIGAKNITELHQLRITGKKVRYTMEGLKLDPDNLVIKNLKILQDDLGNIHDAGLQAETLKKIVKNPSDQIMNRNVGIIIGWTAKARCVSQQKLDKDWLVFLQNTKRWLKVYDK
ncbi:MAG: CHAD domain-containing protein [Negativicutes bacterium]